jgi:hypothetical protein
MRATSYTSRPIDIPASFLAGPSATPIVARDVPFTAGGLPEYEGAIAFTLDNVLSPAECRALLALAEESVPRTAEEEAAAGFSAWRPAMVSVGVGLEFMDTEYRNSDRIVWDRQEVVDRIWRRCADVPRVKEAMAAVDKLAPEQHGHWEFTQPNRRMRFLKYTKGQFFRAHCDGPYGYLKDDTEYQTHFTLHLYLNDADPSGGLVGGATSFLGSDEVRRLDVDPKAGSVLVFQHENLLHEGAEVEAGVKYTMRTDLLFKYVEDDDD